MAWYLTPHWRIGVMRFNWLWKKRPPHDTPPDTRVAFDFQAAVGYPLTLRLSPWQSATPFAWQSDVNGEPVASGTFLAPIGIGWALLATTHAPALMAGMPESVREVIRLAPFLGVELAQVCGQLRAAQELAVSSPLLLILLVERGVQESWTPAFFDHLLGKRQAEQCAAVGLDNTNACAKLLRRCALWPMIPRDLRELVRPLHRNDDTVLLRHHASLNLAHLLFLARYEGERWPGLLVLIDGTLEHDTPRPGAHLWLKRMITDTACMLPATPQALYRVRTAAALQALHDRQIQRFNADLHADDGQQNAAALQRRHGDYPAPPLPGTKAITPLTSWQALLQEGQRMGHCVGSYDRSVAHGRLAIYHMQAPQALTIAIAPQGNHWVLSQARGVRNAMPLDEAQKAIQAWLTTVQPRAS
ncbi:PcfJ domain-containing protein [Halomonas vilamensis]|uniref:PcfJ domain-containing protein n=1 Tax=Vreelandella vilamensis TaxID=531309 RepID=A0ABU1H7Z0_9GAMM|nr:PcfJ domain-containing protein [Halomonas vilamensis]MDR5900427.1 PcfJ domain-containing protein [Halomonas vilamensis]